MMCKLRIRSVVYPYNSSPINQAGFLGARRTVEIRPGPILHAMVKVLMSNANVDGHHVISSFSNIYNTLQCLILSNTHCSFLLKYLFINGEYLAVCNTQLSRHALRCGSRWGGRCNKNLMHYALYCKVETGWCSRRPKNKSPDRDDSFDWEPASCKGNLITP